MKPKSNLKLCLLTLQKNRKIIPNFILIHNKKNCNFFSWLWYKYERYDGYESFMYQLFDVLLQQHIMSCALMWFMCLPPRGLHRENIK